LDFGALLLQQYPYVLEQPSWKIYGHGHLTNEDRIFISNNKEKWSIF
jgi:hypothetical protein